MTPYEGDSLWTATLSQHLFGTNVEYWIDALDSGGNSAHAGGSFFLKRLGGGGITGMVVIGTGTQSDYYAPPFGYYDQYMWSREIYMANEFSEQELGGLIETIGYNQISTDYTNLNNLSLYMKAIPDNALGTSYTDPLNDGFTLVWSGSYSGSQGWQDFTLTTPFVLPPNHNLLVHWENKSGTYTSYRFYGTNYSQSMCLWNYGWNSFPSTGGYTTTVRSNIRVFLRTMGTDDSNSVALHTITTPAPGAAYGSVPVEVVIKNAGIKNLTSAQISWSVNGVPQTSVTWTGNLPSDFNDTVKVGSYQQSFDTYDTVVI